MGIGGSILDLGCGSGSTANELSGTAYQVYTGVDISDVALENAKKRTEENRRGDKNQYFQSNIFSYVLTRRYDARWIYSNYLKERGVFIVVAIALGLAISACSSGSTGGAAGGQNVTIKSLDALKFDPSTSTVKAGQAVNITLDNNH